MIVGKTIKKLTVIAGAGASVGLGVPSTADLTTHLASVECTVGVNLEEDNDIRPNHHIFQSLVKALSSYYTAPNFEHVLEALEAIHSLMTSWGSASERFKTMEGLLTSGPKLDLAPFFNSYVVIDARRCFFRELHNAISVGCTQSRSNPFWQQYVAFWKELTRHFKLLVGTLNYDTLIESTSAEFGQGFVEISGEVAKKFDANSFRHCNNKLAHLHGSTNFGYRGIGTGIDINRFLFVEDFADLYFFDDPNVALRSWTESNYNTAQTGRQAIVGPLISGFAKPDKILVADPYQTYYRLLAEALELCPRLLVIGYGFSDLYINSLLRRVTQWHNAERRIVYIGFCPEDRWKPSSVWTDERHEEFETLAVWGRESTPLRNQDYLMPWISQDKALRVYYCGFHDAIQHHLSEIVKFLSS